MRKLYLYRPRKHKCRPFCDPEGRFDFSESVFSLRPMPHCCMRARVHCVPKVQASERVVVLDPQQSPEEIKRRQVELALKVGFLLLQLFPNGGATDIVFVTLFSTAVGTATAWYTKCCAMPSGHCLNILLFWRRSTASLVFRVGACLESSLFFPPLSPSLIGLLASMDVKQHYSSPLRVCWKIVTEKIKNVNKK